MTVCIYGRHEIEGPAILSPIYGGPACAQHAMQALSVAALTPASHDTLQDTRAELELGEDFDAYPPPVSDRERLKLVSVTGGQPSSGDKAAPLVPTQQSGPELSSRGRTAATQDVSEPTDGPRRLA